MNKDITPIINSQNIETIQAQILKKNSNKPYFSTNKTVQPVITDMDHHPYTRWFRGVYYYPDPIIMEREAGWRQTKDYCYGLVVPPQEDPEPHHCFEVPCTTTLPCYPKYLTKYADKDSLDVMINNACISQYR